MIITKNEKVLAVCLALQSKGFLGNDGAEMFQTLNCVLKIKGDEPNLTVLRKKGKIISYQLYATCLVSCCESPVPCVGYALQ